MNLTLEVEPRLEAAAYTGHSATGWYLMGPPAAPVAVVAFLNGMQGPTVESADTDFNTLGTQWRCYIDLGAALCDFGLRGRETMIDVQLHLRGEQTQRRKLSAVPTVGSYLYGPEDRLFRVDSLVFDRRSIGVYCVGVSARLAADLQAQWAAWDEPAA